MTDAIGLVCHQKTRNSKKENCKTSHKFSHKPAFDTCRAREVRSSLEEERRDKVPPDLQTRTSRFQA
jgi:hypothetical protein